MSDQLSMFSPTTSEDSPRRISSLASEFGLMPFGKQDGPTIDPSGQAAALARDSASPAQAKGSTTSATYGQSSSASSASADLQRSLVNRLRARLPLPGLTLFRMTWKERATPSGRQICALRASVLPTSGKGCIGWPTPCKRDADRGGMAMPVRKSGTGASLLDVAKLSGWPTPRREDSESTGAHHGRPDTLHSATQLCGWATPASHEAGGTPEQFLERKKKAKANGAELGVSLTSLSPQAQTAGWSTPTVQDAESRDRHNQRDGSVLLSLCGQARLADSGETPNGLPAPTEKRGQLNPEHARWLQGVPAAWASFAPTGMRSRRRSRRNSSKQ